MWQSRWWTARLTVDPDDVDHSIAVTRSIPIEGELRAIGREVRTLVSSGCRCWRHGASNDIAPVPVNQPDTGQTTTKIESFEWDSNGIGRYHGIAIKYTGGLGCELAHRAT